VFVIRQKIEVQNLGAYQEELGQTFLQKCDDLSDIGAQFTGLGDFSINFSEDELKRIQEAQKAYADIKVKKRAKDDLGQGNYMQYAAAEAMLGAGQGLAKGGGEGGGMMQGGLGFGMGMSMAQMYQQQMNPYGPQGGPPGGMPPQGGYPQQGGGTQATAPMAVPTPQVGNDGQVNCTQCGKRVPPGKFCAECGATMAPTPKPCAGCATMNPPGSKFCANCGTKM